MLLAIFCSLLFFTSCDVVPKLSSISKISTSFNTGSAVFPGGLIIYGIRTDEAGTAAFTFTDGVATPIAMDRGDWTFYAVGYSGDDDLDGFYTPASTSDGKFLGAISCGTANATFRGGKAASVDLAITPEGCAGKLSRTLKFKDIQIRACAANYNYSKATNTFTTPLVFDVSATCDVPLDQQSDVSWFKVSALNLQNGVSEKTFSSKCYNDVGPNLHLPSGDLPLNVSYYRSEALCNSTLAAHNDFAMVNGITAGLPAEFDHRLDPVTASISRLNLPVAHTKRFTSPFMNIIPRFMCDISDDCFSLPVLENMAEVPWDAPLKKHLLMKDVPATSCAGLKYNSKFFNIEDCEVRNRSVYGTIQRNILTCRDSAGPASIFMDIYARNERIYILSRNATHSSVSVLTKGGSLIKYSPTFLGADYMSVAASDDGDIFVTSPTVGTKVLTEDTNGNYSVTRDFPTLFGTSIEVSASGGIMYLVKSAFTNTVNVINSFDASESDSMVLTGVIKKMQLYKNTLHVLENAATGDPTPFREVMGRIHILNVDSSGNLEWSTNLPSGYGLISFHIDNSDTLNTYSSPDAPGSVFRFKQNAAGVWTIANGASGVGLPVNTDRIVVSDEVAIGIDVNTTNFYGMRWNSNGAWVASNAIDSCAESFDMLLAGSSVSYSMRTVKAPAEAQLNPPLWESALKFAGRNKVGVIIEGNYSVNQYFYNPLNEESVVSTTGGKLNRAMKLLGPNGVGGMLHEYTSCDEIKNILSLSPVPITKSFSVDNPYTGLRSYQIQVSKSTEALDPFNCNDATIASNPACPDQYDLLVNVTSTGLLEKENYRMKLSCTKDAGELDYLKYDANETRKEFSLWNTTNLAAARVDSFKSLQRGDYFRGEMAMVSKYSAEDLWAREIMFEKKASETFMEETEYSRQQNFHMTANVEIEGDPSLQAPAVRDNSSLTSPERCLEHADSNINSGGSLCVITTQFLNNSKGIPLILREMEDAERVSSGFQSVFQIQP